MNVTATTVCINENEFKVLLDIQGSAGTYTVSNDITSNILSTGIHEFGTYDKSEHANIYISDATDSNCSIHINRRYAECEACDFVPTNNACNDALSLDNGENGPFNNYCANTANNASITASCLADNITKTVWFEYEGTGNYTILTLFVAML